MWVAIALHNGESLTCDCCDKEIFGNDIKVVELHLCIDRVNDVDEVVCSDCWEKRK